MAQGWGWIYFLGGLFPPPPTALKEPEQPPAVRPAPAMVFPDSRGGHRAAFPPPAVRGGPRGSARPRPAAPPRGSPACCGLHRPAAFPTRGGERSHPTEPSGCGGTGGLRSASVWPLPPPPPPLGWQWPVGFFMGSGWGGRRRCGDEKEEWVQQLSAWEGGLRGLFCSSPRALGGRGRSQPSGRCSS